MTLAVDLSFSYLFSPFNTDMAVNSQAIGVCIEFKSLPSGDHCCTFVLSADNCLSEPFLKAALIPQHLSPKLRVSIWKGRPLCHPGSSCVPRTINQLSKVNMH